MATDRRIQTQWSRGQRLHTINATTSQFRFQFGVTIARHLLNSVRGVQVLGRFLTRVMMAIFGRRFGMTVEVWPFTRFFNSLRRFAFAHFGLFAIRVASSMIRVNSIGNTFRTHRIVRAFVTFYRFQTFVHQGFHVGAYHRQRHVCRRSFHHTQVGVIASGFSVSQYNIRIFGLRFTCTAAIGDMDPTNVRNVGVGVFHPFTRFFVQNGNSTGVAVQGIFLLRCHRHNRSFYGANFIVNAWRNFAVNNGRHLAR